MVAYNMVSFTRLQQYIEDLFIVQDIKCYVDIVSVCPADAVVNLHTY